MALAGTVSCKIIITTVTFSVMIIVFVIMYYTTLINHNVNTERFSHKTDITNTSRKCPVKTFSIKPMLIS